MAAALSGWLGLVLFAAAIGLVAGLEVRDQLAGPVSAEDAGAARRRRWRPALLLAVLLAACGVATVVRFVVHLS